MADEPEEVVDEVLGSEVLPAEGGDDTTPAAFDPEAVARIAGWSPKSEWRGDPADWKDAGTFLVDTAAVNKTLRKDVKELRRTVEGVGKTTTRLLADAQAAALAQARAELRQAVQAGDEDAAQAAAERIEKAATTPADTGASSADEFAEEHPWFGIHAAATGLAQTEAEKVFRKGGDVKAQFAAAEKIVRTKFPELFEDEPAPVATAERRTAPPVQGGQRSTTTAPKTGFSSLPKEAQAAAHQFVAASKGKITLEAFAKTYYEENA